MTAFEDIHREIDGVSERRADLYHALSEGHDPALVGELKLLGERLDQLYSELRALKARLRFGDREKIVARARTEERLERHAA
jgi:hypothetical protein